MAEQEIVSPGQFSPVLPQYSSLFRYNISFINPPLAEFDKILLLRMVFPPGFNSPLGYIIPRCNILSNSPRSGSINDNISLYLQIIKLL